MTTYRLHDIGASFKKILNGRQWVGRVYQHAETKRWHGVIKQHDGDKRAEGSTAEEAFRNVAALALGFATPEDVLASNATVRRANKVRRRHVQYVASEMRRGNFAPFGEMMDKAFGPLGAPKQPAQPAQPTGDATEHALAQSRPPLRNVLGRR